MVWYTILGDSTVMLAVPPGGKLVSECHLYANNASGKFTCKGVNCIFFGT